MTARLFVYLDSHALDPGTSGSRTSGSGSLGSGTSSSGSGTPGSGSGTLGSGSVTSGSEPLLVGEVHFSTKAGRLVSSTFRYRSTYLDKPGAFAIDPELPLFDTGPRHVDGLPGALQDCCPDRWGRNLIVKHHRRTTADAGRATRQLSEADFLIAGSDTTRTGALRFRAEERGTFLSLGSEVPPLIELPRLTHAARDVDDHDDLAGIKALLDAGTGSLGGARPKASVRNGDDLLIAKFPHRADDWDVMAWEKTALDLASAAGIRVPANQLTRIDGRSVLLLGRFDRLDTRRVPYMSAMTLLSARDGGVHDYFEIAEAMTELSASPTADLHELWRRIAFSIVINNTDDHLRNHGFLHRRGGWHLSPVFDVNPNPDEATQRQTGVAGAVDRAESLEALHGLASDFDLDRDEADRVLDEVTGAVSSWRDAALANGIDSTEIKLFTGAFWDGS